MINYIHKLEVTTGVDQYTCEFLPSQGLQFGILPSVISVCPLQYSEKRVSKATLGFTVPLGLYLGQVLRPCQGNCWGSCVASEVAGHEQ